MVDVAEDYRIGVHEDNLVIVGQQPEAELAVVILVVGEFLGVRVADSLDHPQLPAGGGEGAAFSVGDGLVVEEDEVAAGAGAADAVCEDDGAADVALRRVEHRRVGLPLGTVSHRFRT